MFTGQLLQERYLLQEQLRNHPARQTWLAVDQAAEDLQNHRVIVKLVAFGRGVQWDELKLFEREVQVLKQLHYPQIPKYLHSFHIKEPDPWLGLIEEYLPGVSLQTLIHQGQLFSESAICELAAQVLEILIYLHEQKPPILHRDIKPSNLILTPEQKVILVDFGAVQNQVATTGSSFTVVGTYGYTPLEQFGGQAVPASDLYGLGATVLHLLTGVSPAELAQPDLRLQFRDGLRPASGHRISLSPTFANWLDKMTAPALADRFDSATAALRALTSLSTAAPPACAIADVTSVRLQIEEQPQQLRVQIGSLWSDPPQTLQDLVGTALLTLLGPLAIGVLMLLPLGAVYTQQALTTWDIGGISIGLLLLGLGTTAWSLGLNWLKQNLTSTLLEVRNRQLTIKYQLFGYTYWQHHRLTRDVIAIYPVAVNAEENAVFISFRDHAPCQLADQLTTPESMGLTQSLRSWIDQGTLL